MTPPQVSQTVQQHAAALRAREASALLFLALLTLSLDGPADLLGWPVRCAASALCVVATLDALRLRASRPPGQATLPDTARRAASTRPSGLQRPWADDRSTETPRPNGMTRDAALPPVAPPTVAVTHSTVQGTWLPPQAPPAPADQGAVWTPTEHLPRDARPPVGRAWAEHWPPLDLPAGWRCQPAPDGPGLRLERPGLDDLRLLQAGTPLPPGTTGTLYVIWTAGPDLPPEPTGTGWTVSGSPRHLASVLEVL